MKDSAKVDKNLNTLGGNDKTLSHKKIKMSGEVKVNGGIYIKNQIKDSSYSELIKTNTRSVKNTFQNECKSEERNNSKLCLSETSINGPWDVQKVNNNNLPKVIKQMSTRKNKNPFLRPVVVRIQRLNLKLKSNKGVIRKIVKNGTKNKRKNIVNSQLNLNENVSVNTGNRLRRLSTLEESNLSKKLINSSSDNIKIDDFDKERVKNKNSTVLEINNVISVNNKLEKTKKNKELNFIQNSCTKLGTRNLSLSKSTDIRRCKTPSAIANTNTRRSTLTLGKGQIFIEDPFPGEIKPSQKMVEKFNRQFFLSYVKLLRLKNVKNNFSVNELQTSLDERLLREKRRKARKSSVSAVHNKSVSFRETVEVFGDEESSDDTSQDSDENNDSNYKVNIGKMSNNDVLPDKTKTRNASPRDTRNVIINDDKLIESIIIDSSDESDGSDICDKEIKGTKLNDTVYTFL